MLQRIRDRISGWIAGVVIALVAGAFIFWGVEYYFEQGGSNQNSVATVNGVTITDQQFNTTLSQLERQTSSEIGGQALPDMIKAQLKSYAMQSIITQTALTTILHQDGFRIGLPQVQALIEHAPDFQDQGKFSSEKFMQALYGMSMTQDQFLRHIQSQWMTEQVMQGLGASAFVLPSEIGHWYALMHQKRAFGYFIISAKSFLPKITITDEAVKNEYQANQSKYENPAQVSVAYIELSPATLAKAVTVTPADAKAYYDAHLMNYQTPARWTVSQITIPVASNASQVDVQKAQAQAQNIATALSQHKNPGVASQTVTISAAQIDAGLKTTLSNLQIGKASAPLRTPNGFTVLTVLKADPATTSPFNTVQAKIMTVVQHQRINQLLTEKSNQLSDLTYTNPDSLDAASKALNLPIQTTPMMSSAGLKTGLFSNQKLVAAAFSDSVYKSGNNSAPISLPDGSLVVLRVAKKTPSQPIPLAAVSAQIKQSLAQKQAIGQAGLLAYQLQTQLAAGAIPSALAAKYNLQWQSVPMISQLETNKKSPEKSTVPQAILSAAFSTPVSLASKNKLLGTKTILSDANDYAVIGVTDVKDADAHAVPVIDQNEISTQLTTLWSNLLQRYFVASVIADSKIKMNQTAEKQ